MDRDHRHVFRDAHARLACRVERAHRRRDVGDQDGGTASFRREDLQRAESRLPAASTSGWPGSTYSSDCTPTAVVSGHRPADASDDPRYIDETRRCLKAFADQLTKGQRGGR
ncbi:hypothetical protein OG809_38315 [Kribbella soli]